MFKLCCQHPGFGVSRYCRLSLHFYLELSCSKLGSDFTSPGKTFLTPGDRLFTLPSVLENSAHWLGSVHSPSPLLDPEHLEEGEPHTLYQTHTGQIPRPILAPPPTSSVAFGKSHLLPGPWI